MATKINYAALSNHRLGSTFWRMCNLLETKSYTSRAELATDLGVTRARVSKLVQDLYEYDGVVGRRPFKLMPSKTPFAARKESDATTTSSVSAA